MKQKSKKEGANRIPVIIPLVIYHGKESWKIRESLGDMIFEYDSLPKEVKELIPNFKYLLYDLSQFSEEDIKGNVQLTIMLSIFRDVFRKDGQDFLDTIIKAA